MPGFRRAIKTHHTNMDIIKTSDKAAMQSVAKHLRLKSRIKETIEDNTHYVNTRISDAEPPRYQAIVVGPKLYTVKVQVKVFGFWLTVWAETCDFSDGDTRPYIKNCAEEVKDALTDNV